MPMPKGHKSQFCSEGHDTFITGRGADHSCRMCRKINTKEREAAFTPEQRMAKNKSTQASDKKNPERSRRSRQWVWKSVGILNVDGTAFTIVDYDRNYQIQQGRCLGCGKHQTELTRALCVDHDHVSHAFRGLLCYKCNSVLGFAEDDKETLRRLTKYLSQEK